jgi:hypothetical protein
MARRSHPLPPVRIPRSIRIQYEPFTKRFKGFEKLPAVRATFGAKTGQVLRSLRVEYFSARWGYMGVSDQDGHLMVSAYYLAHGKPRDIYLDVVHELVHVRQFREGKQLFPEGFEYVNAPTEIEAYRHCVAEGRRLGMTDAELYKYLKVEWIDEKEVRKLAQNVGVKAPPIRKKRKRKA